MTTDILIHGIIIIDIHINKNIDSDIDEYDGSNISDSSDIDGVDLAG
jgi:hypothetical protein